MTRLSDRSLLPKKSSPTRPAPPADASARRGAASRASFASTALLGVALFAAACERGAGPEAGANAPGGNDPGSASATSAPPAPPPVSYGRDVLPLLSDRCFKCHGPDPATREGKLRLDVREDAVQIRDGRAAIVPGNPGESHLVARLAHPDPQKAMPPKSSKMKPLSAAEAALLARWIAEGAVYEPHWAFVPPRKEPPPAVRDAAWPRDDLDRFVLAELERRGVAPSPPADPETWLRRVTLDLTGLPPTPEELDAFLADAAPDARARAVDRLLYTEPYASRYAERMAAPWLDAARYADTIGLHTDAGRSVWPYRDYVLRALRDDLPYDRFVVEQLAGDLLPELGRAGQIASGFSRLHVQSDEGGAIDAEYLAEYAAERASTTATVFLGLTLACARCHDHKYDPLGQDDFYRLFAYFNSVEEPGVFSQLPDPRRAHEPYVEAPSPEQERERAELVRRREAAVQERDAARPEEDAARAAWEERYRTESGYAPAAAELVAATARGGATPVREPDGFVFFPSAAPDDEEHVLRFRLADPAARLVVLEAAADPRLGDGRVGLAPNGNAVLSSISVERAVPQAAAASDGAPGAAVGAVPVPLVWAAADVEQKNGDFAVVNALDGRGAGYAVDGHRVAGGRTALFVAGEPLGAAPGDEIVVRLRYRSPYARHVLGRVRVSFARLGEEGLRRLPPAYGGQSRVGPFPPAAGVSPFAHAFGPEAKGAFAASARFGDRRWTFREDYVDGVSHATEPGVYALYVARRVYAAAPLEARAKLGSDDAVKAFVDGVEAFAHDVARGVDEARDDVTFRLATGGRDLVLKIVNTGGEGGFHFAPVDDPARANGPLWAVFTPESSRSPALRKRYLAAWRHEHAPAARRLAEEIAALDRRLAELDAAIPRTMVMKDRAASRPAYVLKRGQYDHPDLARGVERGVPRALGRTPADAPADRRGLAAWLVAPENPLFARVAVNRMFETLFGQGLVRTSEDFGLQGERPSHPALLDRLAADFRDDGYSRKRFLRRLVLSATYGQSSRSRPELRDADPENRLLAFFPRRRLPAETLRDQALFVGGVLAERFGGPPVKPRQPAGLWEEVSMPASNTKRYEPGAGDDLRRRAVYTYWKRASPPPTLLVFDAPTRESCQVRRTATNTPLQALASWNDPDFLSAARGLARRALAAAPDATDAARLAALFRRAAGRAPVAAEAATLRDALAAFRARYGADPAAARALYGLDDPVAAAVGAAAPADDAGFAEAAAWTMVASVVLNADATCSRS